MAGLPVPAAWGVAFAVTAACVATVQSQGRFTAQAQLVPVMVTVQRDDGSYVADLEASDFKVLDNGTPRDIQLFDAGTAPIDLVLLVDTSSSVNARLATIQKAATAVVGALRGEDRATLIAFGHGTRIVQPFTTDRRRVASALRRLGAGGSTSLYDALYVALHEFERQAAGHTTIRRRAVVVFTDGEDTASLIGFDSVIDAARRLAVTTYTIRFVSPFERVDRFARSAVELRELARETGARAFTSSGSEQAAVAYEAVASDLTHQYVLAFEPAGPPGLHRIAVVVGVPHSRVLSRSGYLAE